MQRTYNRFDPWVKQDDFLTGWPSFIEHKNLDWLRDGYWITLWPKVNKTVLTWTDAIRWMESRQLTTVDLDDTYAWWDNWVIYKFNWVDNTPAFTLVNWYNIIQTVKLWNSLFFFYKDSFTTTSVWMAKIGINDAKNDNWWAINENFKALWTLVHVAVPPVIVIGTKMFFWNTRTWVSNMDEAWTIVTRTFLDDYCSSITLQWSTLAVYTRSWRIYFWDGAATTENARWIVWARVQEADTLDWRDYITTEDWQCKVWSYTSFQRLTKPKQSFRWEDNSVLSDRLNFTESDPDGHQNHTIRIAKDDVYLFNSDTIAWLYKYGNVIPWLGKWFHKIITQNHLWTQINLIYDIYYYERNDRKLYFSYKAWSEYGIDHIDLDDLTTNTDWYGVTEVFTGWTSFKKQINRIRVNVSNVDADNYINLYYRKNNWAWVLLRNIISTTDDIYYRENITTESTWVSLKNFIDIQFKVEFHSNNGDNTPPTLHELMLDYDIIET